MNTALPNTQRPPYGIIAIMMVGAFVSMFNETIFSVALPSVMKDLDIPATTGQWLSTGYMLVNGIVIPLSAFLIQKYSARRLFITAMTLFSIGTIIAGFAPGFEVLITARMIQASGAAIMMPLLMNFMLTSFPPHKRGMAMGLFGLVFMVAPAIGPTFAGWILTFSDWRALFHIVSPIAIIVLLLGILLLKDTSVKNKEIKIDIASMILSSFGFGGLLYGFSSAGSHGWSDQRVYISLAIGVISLTLFIIRQFKLEVPMLNFRVYKSPMFALSSAVSVVISMAMFSAMLLLPLYVQDVRGISTFKSGLLMLPASLIMAVMMPINGKLFDKIGARFLAVPGLVITIVTTYMFSQLTLETSYGTLMILYAMRMFGMSMVMMPVMTNGLNSLPQRLYPHGTAMNSTLQQISGALGSAIMITIMTSQAKEYAKELAVTATEKMTPQMAQSADAVKAMQEQIRQKAMLEGINDAFTVTVGIAIVALLLALFIKRVKPVAEEDTASNATVEVPKSVASGK